MSSTLTCFEKYVTDWLKQPESFDATSEKEKEIYTLAYHLYQDKNYAQATQFFGLLTSLAPKESKYWKGLGASLQMQNEYAQALRCYVCAQTLQTKQPDPYLYVYAADCHFATGDIKQGLKALEGARLSAEEQKDKRVLHHVTLMRQQWSNKK